LEQSYEVEVELLFKIVVVERPFKSQSRAVFLKVEVKRYFHINLRLHVLCNRQASEVSETLLGVNKSVLFIAPNGE